MLLATISILTAAVARLPFEFLKAGPPAFFALTDLFILPCLLYDLATRRRVHRATLWGGLLIIASQPLRLMIAGTHAWIAFATWLTQWVP
jgi:nitrate/nitrite transporter NarK